MKNKQPPLVLHSSFKPNMTAMRRSFTRSPFAEKAALRRIAAPCAMAAQ